MFKNILIEPSQDKQTVQISIFGAYVNLSAEEARDIIEQIKIVALTAELAAEPK